MRSRWSLCANGFKNNAFYREQVISIIYLKFSNLRSGVPYIFCRGRRDKKCKGRLIADYKFSSFQITASSCIFLISVKTIVSFPCKSLVLQRDQNARSQNSLEFSLRNKNVLSRILLVFLSTDKTIRRHKEPPMQQQHKLELEQRISSYALGAALTNFPGSAVRTLI